MTIAPDVLEELDFPTPKLTPALFDALIERLNELLAQILDVIAPMPAPMPLLEEFDRLFPHTEGHYCWCSPSRGMVLRTVTDLEGPFVDDQVATIEYQRWFGGE